MLLKICMQRRVTSEPAHQSYNIYGSDLINPSICLQLARLISICSDMQYIPGEGLSIWRFTSKLFRFRFNRLHIILGPGLVGCVRFRKKNKLSFTHEMIREFQSSHPGVLKLCTKWHRLPVFTTSRGFTMYLGESQVPDV